MREPLTTRDALAIFVVIMAVVMAIIGGVLIWGIYEYENEDPIDNAYLCPVTDNMKIFVIACKEEGYSTAQCYYAYVDAVCYGSVKLEMPCITI